MSPRSARKAFEPTSLSKTDFELLSEFRYRLRRFQRVSEEVVQAEGITPLQYLLLLHIKGFPGRDWASVGELAERLQASHHGAVSLVSRCELAGLVQRRQSQLDHRQVEVHLTRVGQRCVARLAALHQTELQAFAKAFKIPQDPNGSL
ncbi:MAG: MarR family winged helix-turn-helix transcriptional regulator [Janthinobacterium lividum]